MGVTLALLHGLLEEVSTSVAVPQENPALPQSARGKADVDEGDQI
jgi:hypothetical protein